MPKVKLLLQCLPESLEASLWQHNKFLICVAGQVTNDVIHVSTLNVIKRLPWIIDFIEELVTSQNLHRFTWGFRMYS